MSGETDSPVSEQAKIDVENAECSITYRVYNYDNYEDPIQPALENFRMDYSMAGAVHPTVTVEPVTNSAGELIGHDVTIEQ